MKSMLVVFSITLIFFSITAQTNQKYCASYSLYRVKGSLTDFKKKSNVFVSDYLDSIFPPKRNEDFSPIKCLTVYGQHEKLIVNNRFNYQVKEVKLDSAGMVNFSELKCLTIAYIKLKTSNKDKLPVLKAMRKLELEFMFIDTVPDFLTNFPNLEYLGLRLNNIKELPEWLCVLKRLKVLDLANNSFISIPKQILQLDSIENILLANVEGGVTNSLTQNPFVAQVNKINYIEEFDVLQTLLSKPTIKNVYIEVSEENLKKILWKKLEKDVNKNKLKIFVSKAW